MESLRLRYWTLVTSDDQWGRWQENSGAADLAMEAAAWIGCGASQAMAGTYSKKRPCYCRVCSALAAVRKTLRMHKLRKELYEKAERTG